MYYYFYFLYEEIQFGEFKYLVYELIYVRILNVNALNHCIPLMFISKPRKILLCIFYNNLCVEPRIYILDRKAEKFS